MRSEDVFDKIADVILAHRKLVIGALLVLGLVCGLMATQLRFNFTPQQLFESTSDYDKLRDRFAERFGREDNLLSILVRGDDVLTPEALTYIHRSTLALRKLDQVKRAESVTTLEVPRASNGALSTKPIINEALASRGEDPTAPDAKVDAEAARQLRELALKDPLLRGQLVSADGTIAPIMLWVNDDVQDVSDLTRLVEAAQAQLAARPPPPGVTLEFAGIPQVRVDIVKSLRHEQLTFIPFTGLIYVLVLAWLFRRFSGFALPMAVVGLTAAATAALLVATDSPINIINNVLPSLIFIIGVSDSIHMLTRQAEEIEQGKDHMEAVRAMIRHTGMACLLTSTTTAVGFVSLLVADTDILKKLGWQAASAVCFAYAFTLLFLPAALTWLRPVQRLQLEGDASIDPLDPESARHAPIVERIILKIAHGVLGRPRASIALGLAITAVFVALGSRVEIDTTLLEIYSPEHPVYKTTKLMEQKLGGILPVEISVEHKTQKDAFRDPENYKKLQALQEYTKTLPGVLTTQSIVDFHQSARVAVLGDEAQRAVMPESREMISQLQVMLEGPPDAKGGVRSFITDDFRHARLLLRVEDMGAKAMIKHSVGINAQLRALFPPEQGWDTYIAGDAYVASVALDSFVRDLFSSLLMAIVIIFVMMMIVFRSVKMGLISMLPNITPLVLTFGYMGWEGIALNTTTIIIFAISLGLAVDDTIHFLARFREEAERHERVYDALVMTYFGAGRAIVLTSVMLVIGLCVLLMSDFVPTNLFGKLTAITIAGALLGDLLMLPPLLLLVYRKKT